MFFLGKTRKGGGRKNLHQKVFQSFSWYWLSKNETKMWFPMWNLSRPPTLVYANRPRSLVKKDQVKRQGGLSYFVSVKSLEFHLTYCLPRFLDQNRKREDKIRILDTEKVAWKTTSNLHLDKTCFAVEESEEAIVIKPRKEGQGVGRHNQYKETPIHIDINWYFWLSYYGRIYWLLYEI